MKDLKPYEIVRQDIFQIVDYPNFLNEVNDLITKGYQPCGGLAIYHDKYFQAMYKAPAKKTRKAKAGKYSSEFEDVWKNYPKRAGNNPKSNAYTIYRSKIDNDKSKGIVRQNIRQGVIRYAAFCKATRKLGTEYVMMASTFFNQQAYLQDWEIPVDNQMPERDYDLLVWAEKKFGGEGSPKVGESTTAYRARLKAML